MKRTPFAHIFLLIAFILNCLGSFPVQAQELILPKPGVRVHLSPSFSPPLLKGIRIHAENPFLFDFILDQGESKISDRQLREESTRLIKYFLASLTVPEKELWVNLSPYEKDRIIPEHFGVTEMGRDLLAQDYLLKQITASLIYPEEHLGKKFWKKVYEEAAKKYHTTNIPVNTFNKVWIVPSQAKIFQQKDTVLIVRSHLKVLLEQDYLSLQKNSNKESQSTVIPKEEISSLGSQIVRDIVLPELEKEVNEGKNFLQLRQMYHSLILAIWYKKKIKEGILRTLYVDQNKLAGVNVEDQKAKDKIYNQYLEAFKKGVYNYIKEDYDPHQNITVPRKYFSGGASLNLTYGLIDETGTLNEATSSIRRDLLLLPTILRNIALPKAASQQRFKDEAMASIDKEVKAVGFFPGLGSRDAYRNLGSTLYERGIPEVQQVYQEAAVAMGFMDGLNKPDVKRLFLIDENIPKDEQERNGFIGAAFTVHNLALHAYFKAKSKEEGVSLEFNAYTGESLGIFTAAIVSGAVSLRDGIKMAQFFTPSLLSVAAESLDQNYHVIGMRADEVILKRAVAALGEKFKDNVEVHKYYSGGTKGQYNIYVAESVLGEFMEFMSANFPRVSFQELKTSTKFIAHSSKLTKARGALEAFIEREGIIFYDPSVPIISNNNSGMIENAQGVRKAILATVDEPMHSQQTVNMADEVGADLILEFGLGQKTSPLMSSNYVRTPFIEFSSEEDGNNIFLVFKVMNEVRDHLSRIKKWSPSQTIGEEEYDLIRKVFLMLKDNVFAREYFFNFLSHVVQEEVLNKHPEVSEAFYKFLEVCQNTYMVHYVLEAIAISADALVLSAVYKKRVSSAKSERNKKIDVEILVLNSNGREMRFSMPDYKSPETVTFVFNQNGMSFDELTQLTRELLQTQPLAREIYENLVKEFSFDSLEYFTFNNEITPTDERRKGICLMVYQYVMFRLTQLHRPSIFGQNFNYVTATDQLGAFVALASSGAISIADSIRLYKNSYEEKRFEGGGGVVADARIKIIDFRTGKHLKNKGDVERFIKDMLINQDLQNSESISLTFPSWIISYDATKNTFPVETDMEVPTIHIVSLDDLWGRNANTDLDRLEEMSVLRLTDQNDRTFRFAEGRGITTSNVYAYIKAGEEIVGFGTGGSESLTVFIRKPGTADIIVRKILSERLITARWDRGGEGVMQPPFAKAKRQVQYLQGLPEQAHELFPRVFNVEERKLPISPDAPEFEKFGGFYHEFMYDMSFIRGVEVSEFIRQSSPSPQVVAHLYEEIFKVLYNRVHSQRRQAPAGATLESSYFRKIEDRLYLSRRTAPNVFNPKLLGSSHIVINGQRYLNVDALLAEFRGHPEYLNILEPRVHSLVMGDTNTENIKITNVEPILRAMERGDTNFTAEEIGIRFLDPRAIGFHVKGQDTGVDDPMYDNKPWHNSIGNYDAMHGEYFDLEVDVSAEEASVKVSFHPDNPYADSYQGIGDYFRNVMSAAWGIDTPDSPFLKDDPYWLIRFAFMMGTHFTAMPPFHFKTDTDGRMMDDYVHQKRPVAIYAEGIQWLNLAMEMLRGERTEFLGIKVPQLPYETHAVVGQMTQKEDEAMIVAARTILGMTQQDPKQTASGLTKETRAFFSPWIRIVRGVALGGEPISFDSNVAQHLREAAESLDAKMPKSNKYNQFSNLLTKFILDVNDPHIALSGDDLTGRVEILIGTLKEIEEPYLLVNATAILINSFVKLSLPIDSMVNVNRDLLKDALEAATTIPYDSHGAYERITAFANIFLAAGQLGLKDRLVGKEDYISKSLELLKDIPSHYYRGRSASLLFSVLAVLGYQSYFLDEKNNHLSQLLDLFDSNFKSPEALRKELDDLDSNVAQKDKLEEKIFEQTYPLYAILNLIALIKKPEYLTYKRDWLKEAQGLLPLLAADDRINQGQYYLMALHNLGFLEKNIPDLRTFIKEWIESYQAYLLKHSDYKWEKIFISMNDVYVIETAWYFGLTDIIPEALLTRVSNHLKSYKKDEPYFNSAYGLSYALTALSEIGQLDRLFQGSDHFDGESPFKWTIGSFPADGVAEKITLPYLNHSLINQALRMRGDRQERVDLYKDVAFLGDKSDEAMLTKKDAALTVPRQSKSGGIDFNPSNFDVEMEGQGIDFKMTVNDLRSVGGGLTPVILKVIPVTLPYILGLEKNSQEVKLAAI